jgi:hypothetical protein
MSSGVQKFKHRGVIYILQGILERVVLQKMVQASLDSAPESSGHSIAASERSHWLKAWKHSNPYRLYLQDYFTPFKQIDVKD